MHVHRPLDQVMARSTSGARLEMRYDRSTHSVEFVEHGWTVDGREPAAAGTVHRQPLRPAEVIRLTRRPR